MKNFILLLITVFTLHFANAQCTVFPCLQVPATCNGFSNGCGAVCASGGTAPYTYSWVPSACATATCCNLAAGTYTVVVNDALGCFTATAVTITQPPALTATVCSTVNVSCNGGNNGAAVVCPSGGTGPYTYQWSPVGGTGQTAIGLPAFCYTCTVTDNHGCSTMITACITQPTPLSVIPCGVQNVQCNGGNTGCAAICVNGGTSPYTYNWSPTGQTGQTACGLPVGTYTCTIIDANGCTQTSTVSITEPPLLTMTITLINSTTAYITPSGGTPVYSYNWIPSGQSTQTATGLSPGTYIACVTDANGCSVCDSNAINASVKEIAEADKAFSIYPNPSHGTFTVQLKQLSEAKLEIYNALGQEIYHQVINRKQESVNAKLSPGVYFITVKSGTKTYTHKLMIE